MKSLFLLLVLSLLSLSSGQFEMPCLLTNYLEEDHAAYVAEAEELGWYTDGKPDADAVKEKSRVLAVQSIKFVLSQR